MFIIFSLKSMIKQLFDLVYGFPHWAVYMESATIDTEIEDRSRVSPPSYCDHLTPCLYRTILECNLNFTNMRRYEGL